MHLCHHLHMHHYIYIWMVRAEGPLAKKFAVAVRIVHWRSRSVSSRSMLKLWRPIIDPSSFNPKIIHNIVLFKDLKHWHLLLRRLLRSLENQRVKNGSNPIKLEANSWQNGMGCTSLTENYEILLPTLSLYVEIILAVTGSSQRHKAWILNLSLLAFLDKSSRLILYLTNSSNFTG
jgi:hypothetical protein